MMELIADIDWEFEMKKRPIDWLIDWIGYD